MTSTPYRQRLLLKLLSKVNRVKSTGAEGFTLIELLVVIVILGVLGGVGYGAYINQLQRANTNTAQVAATGAAKNCAALIATGDQSAFVPGVDQNRVTLTPATCGLNAQFRATAGTAPNQGTGGANVGTDGSVTPL